MVRLLFEGGDFSKVVSIQQIRYEKEQELHDYASRRHLQSTMNLPH